MSQLGTQWIVEECVNDGDPVVQTFATYEEAYPVYVSKCNQNPTSLVSIRKVERQLLME